MVIATRQHVTGLTDGTYVVIVQHRTNSFFTDNVQITIDTNIPCFQSIIWEVAPFTSCSLPDGQLAAGV